MGAIGLLADSRGDVELLDRALRLLGEQGASRFFFAGNRYDDVDDWVKWKRDEAKKKIDYAPGDFLDDVSDFLAAKAARDRPAAFGVAYELAREAEASVAMREQISRVPEAGCLAFSDPKVPNKLVELAGDVLCCLVHDRNTLDKEDMVNAALLIHGNEKAPKVVQIGPRYFLTPGSLAGGDQSTVGILRSVDRQLTFTALSLTGDVVIEPQILAPGAKTKLSVK